MGDFIKNKIIMRSLMASFTPIVIYSIGFHVHRFMDPGTYESMQLKYFDTYPWLIIAAFSILYPLN